MATIAAAALGTVVLSVPAQAANRSNIEIDLADAKCLDVPNSDFSSGVPVQEWTCNHTSAQKWNVVYVSSQYFQVQVAAKPSLCLNNWSSGGAKGDEIKLYSCASTDSWFNQVGSGWNNYFQFQPKNASANCVTAWGGTAPGNKMRLDSCSNGSYNTYFDLFNLVFSET
ncbi:ricin-type beta-trefoil lectin domain protein [Streptomyces sp. NBC_00386]|uniref:RICIN domain-containing protein n=1 Tax=Streptomyces sp. NBC_00386 TaxID=2975734 RepID=UPI002E1FE724